MCDGNCSPLRWLDCKARKTSLQWRVNDVTSTSAASHARAPHQPFSSTSSMSPAPGLTAAEAGASHLALARPRLQPHSAPSFPCCNHRVSLAHFRSPPPPRSHGGQSRICLSDQLLRNICSSQWIKTLCKLNTKPWVMRCCNRWPWCNTVHAVILFLLTVHLVVI